MDPSRLLQAFADVERGLGPRGRRHRAAVGAHQPTLLLEHGEVLADGHVRDPNRAARSVTRTRPCSSTRRAMWSWRSRAKTSPGRAVDRHDIPVCVQGAEFGCGSGRYRSDSQCQRRELKPIESCGTLRRTKGIPVATVTSPMAVERDLWAQRIELPSWAFGNSGTRFKVFAQAACRASRTRRSPTRPRSTATRASRRRWPSTSPGTRSTTTPISRATREAGVAARDDQLEHVPGRRLHARQRLQPGCPHPPQGH